MKKKIFTLILFILMNINVAVFGSEYFIDDINLRPAKSLFLPKGTFIKVTNIKLVSSQFLDKGDTLNFENTFDIYLGETNLIPQKSIFYGYVEDVKEPVQGTNAAITIKINKLTTPEGISYPMSGTISKDGVTKQIGAERTPALYYTRMPHYTHWKMNRWKIGAAQYLETNTREYGKHTVISSGTELFIILDEDLNFSQ